MNYASDGKDRRAVLERALQAVEEMQAKLNALEREKREPIAIVGMSCRFPGATSPEAYWDLLRRGGDAIREVPPDRWDVDSFYDPDPDCPGKMYTRMGGFVDDVDKFDAYFFGMSPRETLKTDPQQRLAAEVSWEALENAAIAPKDLMGSQTGVFLGITNYDYARIVERAGLECIDAYHLTGNCLNFAAGRIAYLFGLQGPTMAVDTACSSSGVSVHLACQSLRNRECNVALAGGVNLILSPEISITSTKARTLSPDGYCKTFDAGANGYVRGEGCGIVVLKRLSDAIADGDRIHAVIRGSAVNQDGASSGITVPNKVAQAEVMRQALQRAGLEPDQVDYIEAHGTGTPLGDPIEVRALASVYSKGRLPSHPLIIGTAKTNVGHLESAAGVAGLIKVVLSLEHGAVPPHLHFKKLNPAISLDEIPAAIPVQAMSWPRGDRPRVAGLSFFGGSGTIAHMIVEEAPEPPDPKPNSRTSHLFCLSAKNPAALSVLADHYEEHLANAAAESLADVCYTADAGRSHFDHRLAVVSSNAAELRERLSAYRAGAEAVGLSCKQAPTQKPKVAFLLTGQGGQYVNMGRRLYAGEPVFRRIVDECDECLRPHLPRSLRSVLYPEPGEATPLDETRYTHVAMFAVQYGLAALWRSWGVEPSIVMGHSVGEIVAATVAGQMSFEDGLKLMRERGRLMHSLPPAGMMASLLAGEEQVSTALAPFRDRVAIAAINGPESTVISGEKTAVRTILTQLERDGVRVKVLKVSNAFHSPLVAPVLAEFEQIAREVHYTSPRIPLFSSMRLETVGEHNLLDGAYWSYNLRNTVRFSEAIRELYEQDYRLFLEIGPSPVLVSMGSQCVPPGEGVWLPSLREERDDWQQLLETLGHLYVNGVDVNWDGFYRDRRARKMTLPTYPFQRERYWVDSPSRVERPAASGEQGSSTGHPLLGRRLRSAVPLFEQQLSAAGVPFLNDHRVFDRPVLPATAYLELAMAAAAEVFEGRQASVKNTVLAQPLLIPDDEAITIQVTVAEMDPGTANFRVFSLASKGNKELPAWVLHATGDLCIEEEDSPSGSENRFNPSAIQGRCPDQIDRESYYPSLQAWGLAFGPRFRGLERLWRREGEAIGQIRLPLSLSAETEPYRIHPAFLDACFQTVAAALPAAGSTTQTYLPQRLERFRVYRHPGEALWSHVSVHKSAGIEITADIDIFDPTGQTVAEVRGLVLRPVGREAIIPFEHDDLGQLLYEVKWEEAQQPKEKTESACLPLPGPQKIAQALAPYSRRNRSLAALQDFASALPRLETLSTQYVWRALRQLGWEMRPDETFTADAKARDLRVPPSYRRLFARMLQILHEDGYLSKQGDEWRMLRVPPDQDPDEELSALLKNCPACSAELALIGRCGQQFASAIRGESEPLELLFPGGTLTDAVALYRDSPYFRFYNELLQDAVVKAVRALPSDRPLRILEIGAGTGSTTSYLLPKLPPQRTEYVFTDVSTFFISKAREAFSAYPFVNYRVLDIEKNPLEQGFTAHSFDLIIAANVLHATADLRHTLQQVRTLVSSEGLLVLLEGVRALRFTDIIVGLTEGWWKFRDAELRPSHALVSDDQWRKLLAETGFAETAVALEQDGESVLSNQSLILARAPSAAGKGTWLVFSDRGDTGKGLESALQSRGESCVMVFSGGSYVRRDPWRFEIDPANPEHFQAIVREAAGSNGSTVNGVIFLWPLDCSAASIDDWESTKTALQSACGGLLYLVKALISGGAPLSNHLWIVTRGARSVDSATVFNSLPQSPASALGATIGLEYPELHCVRLDLDPTAVTSEAEMLLQEITNEKHEDLVAFRHGRRFVARLVQGSIAPCGPPNRTNAEGNQPRRLTISSPGVLDNLHLAPMDRRPPGQGEVEIEVHATGLGFRDVLIGLGRYPGESQEFGYECAGTVVRVGPGVTDVHAGQRVMAVGPGSFSSFLTISTDWIAPIPARLRVEEAATLPSAFLTAQYALCRLGRISAGERVLIHAAAGGVGLAAVQLARRAGAEIFATAGTPEKRACLKSLGVPHVMDSRSLDFAGKIMEITAGQGVDLVLNCLAGEFIPKSLSITANNGRFLEIGRTGIWDALQVAHLGRNISYFPIDLASTFERSPELVRSLFDELLPDFAAGRLQPLPVYELPLEKVISAFRFMAQARHTGKIVVSHPVLRKARTHREPDREEILRPDATYLITGGWGGLGLLVAQWMSENGARHLVLTGRSQPSAAAVAAIGQMEKKGVRVVVARGDTSDRAHLVELFSEFGRSLPPLRGIVHSAGIVDDGVLTQQTWDRFERVMAPKVDGAWHLHALSESQPLDFFVLFSSAVALLGSAGQGNHVAACAFEDALAHYRHSLGLPALSINWGPWGQIGAATHGDVTQRLRVRGFHPMQPQQGLRMFEHLLPSDRVQAGVMSVDWRQYTGSLPPGHSSKLLSRVLPAGDARPPNESRKAAQTPALIEQLSQESPKKRRQLLEAHIREQAVKVLGLSPSFKLDPNQGLATFGMDSLMTIELKNRLQASVGKTMPSTIVFDHPTLAALAEYLDQTLFAAEDSKPVGAKAKPAAEEAEIPAELAKLSDAEAEAILAKELSNLA